jgi:hypothetical protein
MKKTLLFLLLVAASASAGTYTVTTNAVNDARLARQLARVNKATCASVNLPASCTQAQARAVTPGLDVYSNVADMIDRTILRDFLANLKNADTSDDAIQAAAAWAAMNDTQKNAVCALLGLPNGCEAWSR